MFDGRPVVVEIGFGLGDATIEMATADRSTGIVAIDVHTPGVARLAMAVDRLGLDNVLVVCDDAVEFLRDRVPERSLAGIRVFFPDPWPKARHHKRRLVRPDLVSLMASRLVPAASCTAPRTGRSTPRSCARCSTRSRCWSNAYDGDAPRLDRPMTKFELTGLQKGHPVVDLVSYVRGADGTLSGGRAHPPQGRHQLRCHTRQGDQVLLHAAGAVSGRREGASAVGPPQSGRHLPPAAVDAAARQLGRRPWTPGRPRRTRGPRSAMREGVRRRAAGLTAIRVVMVGS